MQKGSGACIPESEKPAQRQARVGLVNRMVWGNRSARVLAQRDPLAWLIDRLVFMPVGRSVCDSSETVGSLT